MSIEEMKQKERELWEICQASDAAYKKASKDWSEVYNIISEHDRREAMRAELLKEMEAAKV